MTPDTKTTGFLFLCHRGVGMMDDLVDRATKLGFESYVLSSRPADKNAAKAAASAAQAAWSRTSALPSLSSADVAAAVGELTRAGKRILGCVSVWEGYRRLMAETNLRIGAADLAPAEVDFLLDKYRVRQALREEGLSNVNARVLTPELLARLATDGRPQFIKPRRGIASIGAFKLKPLESEISYERLTRLLEELAADDDYRDLNIQGSGDSPFIAEDYIAGQEYSFEVIVDAGRPHIVAVHEKTELEEQAETTLESACLCPPVRIARRPLARGKRFVARVVAALGLDTGLFHIEAKHDESTGSWEIIEINPRIGGALINSSVQSVTGGCLLDLWLRLFITGARRERRALYARLASGGARKEAFFRVYFGAPGRRIESIEFEPGLTQPKVVRVMGKAGDQLPRSSREIFLGQALWEFEPGTLATILDTLAAASRAALRVHYQPSL